MGIDKWIKFGNPKDGYILEVIIQNNQMSIQRNQCKNIVNCVYIFIALVSRYIKENVKV